MIPNGIYTFTNTKGEHRTFKVKTQKKDAKFAPGRRIAALLTGADNENDYTGFGFIEEDGKVKVWNTRRNSTYEYYAKMIALAGQVVNLTKEETEGVIHCSGHRYEFKASRRCMVCNRTLTCPESIKTGIGPICRAA